MGIKLIDAQKRKYRVAFWYKNRHYAKVITGNRKLAQDVEAQMRLDLAEGRYFPHRNRPNLSFSEAAKRFMDQFASNKPSSKQYYYNTLSATKYFGSKPVHDITPEDIRQYRAKESERGLSPVSVNHYQKNLRRLFNWLEQVGLFEGKNPASSKFVPLVNEKRYWRRNFLTHEQFQKLLEVAHPRIRTIIITAAHTGMRHGELRAIRKEHVNLDRCTIWIPQSKNGEPGSVPMTETLFATLEPLVRALPSPESKVLDFTHYDKLWKQARADAGLLHEVWEEGMNRWQKIKANKNFHLHDLRHTAASHAIMGSKDPYAVQHFLRLKTQSLMARYAHLLPGHVRQAALTLDAQLPVSASLPITIQQGETALISAEPIRNSNNQPQPTTANS
jgi:integrase